MTSWIFHFVKIIISYLWQKIVRVASLVNQFTVNPQIICVDLIGDFHMKEKFAKNKYAQIKFPTHFWNPNIRLRCCYYPGIIQVFNVHFKGCSECYKSSEIISFGPDNELPCAVVSNELPCAVVCNAWSLDLGFGTKIEPF